MTPKHLFLLLLFSGFISCDFNSSSDTGIDGKRLAITDSIEADSEIADFIRPFKEHLNSTLDSTLAHNPMDLSKSDGDLNTGIGNLMADIVMEQANPVFNSRTGKNIDVVLLNQGGIRSSLNKGNVSTRSAYGLMPFENEIVIAELSAEKILEMLNYLEKSKTAHPLSGIQITVDKNYETTEVLIQGEEIDSSATYLVATSDYLQQGGDNMNFLKDPVELYNVDYKIRNAIIDYFHKVDTIKTGIDNRFIQQ